MNTTAKPRRRQPTRICSRRAHDDALFEHYFASQLAAVNTSTGAKTTIGRPSIFSSVQPSPGGEYVR